MYLARLTIRILGMAVEAVWAFKLRSLFVVMGVACGIASLTLIVTSVDGANRMAVQIVEMFGHDAAFVLGGNIEKRAVGMRRNTLTLSDAQRIRSSLPGAYLVVPMRAKFDLTIKHGAEKIFNQRVIGSTANYADAWNWPLAEGRDISEEDQKRGARVVLLGDAPSRALFGEDSPVGKVVYIQSIPFQVIGRLAYRGIQTGGGGNIDDRVVIPLSTLTSRFNLDRKYFRALRVKFLEPEYMSSHTENLRSLLRDAHGLRDGDDDDFTILTADEVLEFLSKFKGGLTIFLGITALCAVVVGGFVLANLFLLGVQERSQEIGLKKAMGAHGSAILLQFLLEACILTFVGGVLGLALGLGLGQLLTRLGILTIQFSWKAFFMALASAQVIGVIFALKPARQAAAMDPITALKGGD